MQTISHLKLMGMTHFDTDGMLLIVTWTGFHFQNSHYAERSRKIAAISIAHRLHFFCLQQRQEFEGTFLIVISGYKEYHIHSNEHTEGLIKSFDMGAIFSRSNTNKKLIMYILLFKPATFMGYRPGV